VTPLDPRFVTMQRELARYVTALVALGLLVGLPLSLGVRRWYWWLPIWLVATVVSGWWFYRWPAIEYQHTRYALAEDGIEIHRGVVWREVVNVPRSRVQHTDVSQGPLERKHSLGRLVIYTAGTADSKVELPGLDHRTALSLRDQLLPRQATDAV